MCGHVCKFGPCADWRHHLAPIGATGAAWRNRRNRHERTLPNQPAIPASPLFYTKSVIRTWALLPGSRVQSYHASIALVF